MSLLYMVRSLFLKTAPGPNKNQIKISEVQTFGLFQSIRSGPVPHFPEIPARFRTVGTPIDTYAPVPYKWNYLDVERSKNELYCTLAVRWMNPDLWLGVYSIVANDTYPCQLQSITIYSGFRMSYSYFTSKSII